MTTDQDRQLDDYLWDPTASPVAEVTALEEVLRTVSAGQTARPLELPRPARRARRIVTWTAAAAAALVLLTSGYLAWRSRWPSNQPWPLRAPAGPAVLAVGRTLHVESDARAAIARIGTMRIERGSELTLESTTSNRHRLMLERGAIDVRVWAPPRSVVIETPAGEVGDLGCQFHLLVDRQGVARVTVLTGWVQLDNIHGETLVPAGASAEMSSDRQPLVPVYDDASAAFRDAVRRLETQHSGESTVAAGARRRDVLTLLVLAIRESGAARADLLHGAARLSPPPADIRIPLAIGGDDEEIWRWYGTLPLPPPKTSWWRNWRDGLPSWLAATPSG